MRKGRWDENRTPINKEKKKWEKNKEKSFTEVVSQKSKGDENKDREGMTQKPTQICKDFSGQIFEKLQAAVN